MNKEEIKKELAKRELASRRMEYFVKYIKPDNDFAPHIKQISEKLDEVMEGKIKRLIITMPPRHGKLCADSTDVLTPNGWKKHGDLCVGDTVFHPNGRKINIIAVSEKDYASLEITFSNGEKIKVHPNHEWTVYDRSTSKLITLETKKIFNKNYYSGNRSRFQLPNILALDNDTLELPLDPYFFGAWLGDGTSKKPAITSEFKDKSIIDNIPYKVSCFNVHKHTGVPTYYYSYQNIIQKIKKLNCYNNKHIPKIYKISSIEQRLQLLAGILDTDGSKDKNSRYRIVTASKKLAKDIAEVVISLGMRPYIMEQEPRMSTSGIHGKQVVYSVGFQPTMEIPVALERKRVTRIAKQRMIGIVSIRECEPELGKCIQVDSPDGLYLVGKTLIPTHNSEMISRLFPAYFFGKRPKEELIHASYSASLAEDFGRDIRSIVNSKEYHNVFDTKLADDSQAKARWSTKEGGNYNAVGVGGGITGKGGNIIIDDPVKNREEAESVTVRESIWNWYTSTAYTRLPPNGFIIVLMTRWHEDDLVGKILANDTKGEWNVLHLPAISNEGTALWEARYPIQELQNIKDNIGLYDFSALYQGEPVDQSTQEFKKEWIRYVHFSEIEKKNTNCFLTIDPAMSKKDSADYTGFCLNWVDSENKWHIKAWGERLNPTELIDKIFQIYQTYNPINIGIEENQYTTGILPFFQEECRKRNIFPPMSSLKHGGVNKETRIRSIIPRYQSFSVFHIENECAMLEEQMFTFPKARHDDVIDALAYQISIASAPYSNNDTYKTYQSDVIYSDIGV